MQGTRVHAPVTTRRGCAAIWQVSLLTGCKWHCFLVPSITTTTTKTLGGQLDGLALECCISSRFNVMGTAVQITLCPCWEATNKPPRNNIIQDTSFNTISFTWQYTTVIVTSRSPGHGLVWLYKRRRRRRIVQVRFRLLLVLISLFLFPRQLLPQSSRNSSSSISAIFRAHHY